MPSPFIFLWAEESSNDEVVTGKPLLYKHITLQLGTKLFPLQNTASWYHQNWSYMLRRLTPMVQAINITSVLSRNQSPRNHKHHYDHHVSREYKGPASPFSHKWEREMSNDVVVTAKLLFCSACRQVNAHSVYSTGSNNVCLLLFPHWS